MWHLKTQLSACATEAKNKETFGGTRAERQYVQYEMRYMKEREERARQIRERQAQGGLGKTVMQEKRDKHSAVDCNTPSATRNCGRVGEHAGTPANVRPRFRP